MYMVRTNFVLQYLNFILAMYVAAASNGQGLIAAVVQNDVQKAERKNAGADPQYPDLLTRGSRCIRRPRVTVRRIGEHQTT